MHVLASLYVMALCCILWLGISRSRLGLLRTTLATFLMVWAVWIVTAHALSLFSVMNVTWLFVALSLAIAALSSVGLRCIRAERELHFPEFASPFSARVATWVFAFLAITAIMVVISDLMLARGFLPANPDSIVYRFPRAYWYFGHGALSHFGNWGDPRPQFYPFNGAIAYLPLLHFELGPRSFSLMSLACWMMSGLATYVFARDLGGPRVVATATAWLIFLTPNVLLQSLSTNDELIAAAPMLAGLFFLHRWIKGRQAFDALIGTVGVAISVGTKLHATFYLPLLLAVALFCLYQYRATFAEMRRWLSLRGVSFLALLGVIVAVFSLSFMAFNYKASGRIMDWDFAAQIQNKPFSGSTALQTGVLQIANIVLTPIADLHMGNSNDSTSRSLHYLAFNKLFAPLFTWVDNGPAFTSAGYRFNGVNTPNSVLFNEHTVYIGFFWLVWLMAAAHQLLTRGSFSSVWGRFHLAAFPVWFITYALSSRYIDGFSVYLAYATIIAAPALVYAFAPIAGTRLNRTRWIMLAFVGAAHAFFAGSILLTSPAKNLKTMQRATVLPSSRGFTVDQSITDEIGRAKSGVYQYSITWGQPYWAMMAYHPEIRQFVAAPSKSAQPSDLTIDAARAQWRSSYALMPASNTSGLHVYSFPQTPLFGHAIPIRIPDKSMPGLTWIGNMMFSLGPEWIFAAGNAVEDRHSGRDKYMVLRFNEPAGIGPRGELAVSIHGEIYGIRAGDDLSFRSEVSINGSIVSQTDWQATPATVLVAPDVKPGNGVLTVQVRNNKTGSVASTNVQLQSPALPPRDP